MQTWHKMTSSIILNSYLRCIFIVSANADLYCPLLKAKTYILRPSGLDATCPLHNSIKQHWVNGANQILLSRRCRLYVLDLF